MASQSKSCESDPLPSWLLKKCLDQLLPTITKIVNISLSKGIFPSCYKNAIIRPLLKNYNLNQDDLKNYRPVANLPFVSKIIEKAVCDKIDLHIGSNNLHEKFQSAYRKCHSTETALIRTQADIMSALNNGSSVAMVMLDLKAAFDTLDHQILLNRLEEIYSIQDVALQYFGHICVTVCSMLW